MQPLNPDDKKRILESSIQASPEDIEEYEKLLSERFTEDPDLPGAQVVLEGVVDPREARLAELYQKLFKP
jgi:hypothetical protein